MFKDILSDCLQNQTLEFYVTKQQHLLASLNENNEFMLTQDL